MNSPEEEYKEIKFNNNYIYKQSNDYNDTMNLSKLKVDKEELSETLVEDKEELSKTLVEDKEVLSKTLVEDKEELSKTLVEDNQNNSNLLLSNLKYGGDNNTNENITFNENSVENSVENNNEELNNNENSVENNNEELNNENSEENNNENSEENNDENDNEKIIEREAPNEESELKSIVFSNNNQISNIYFDNVENNNISKFLANNGDIIVEEEVALKNSEIIYKDDNIYLKELINQFLSEYKVTSQESKYIQEIVEKKALDVIDIKNIGIIENDMNERGIEYKLIYDMFYDKFKSNVVIPIVSDKHKIYVKLKDNAKNENNENNVNNKVNDKLNLNIYFSESLEDKNGTIEENQFNQFILLKELYHNRAINKIEYQNYINEFFEISKPYILNMENLGYIKRPKNDSLVLRYSNIDTIHWNTYNIDSGFSNKKDLFDEKGKIIGQEDNILIKSNEANIIGFMILSSKDNNFNKQFEKIGEITKIYNTDKGIIIECPNHNIKQNEIIYIDNTDSYPPINSVFNKSVEILNNNSIKLNVDFKLLKESTKGDLYKLSNLHYNQYEIIKKDDKLEAILKKSDNNIINNNVINNNLENATNKVYLFNNLNINKNDYENIIKLIMPSLSDIVENYKNDLNNVYTYDDVNDLFKKYNLTINDFNIKQITFIKEVLTNNLNKLLTYYDNLDKKNIILKFNKNNKKIFDSNYFLSNKYITDKSIESIYGKYNYIGKPEDNIILRLRWIESMNDNGKYYYLNYVSKQNLDYDLKYISDKKKNITKLLTELEKTFNKELINSKNNPSKMYRYQAYKIKSDDGLEKDGFPKLKLQDGSYVFYNNNIYLWKGKLVDIENIENNSLALVEHELWVYKNNKWEKSNTVPKYDNIAYLCSLNNTELSNLKIDSLDCIYRKGSGCNSKLYYRLMDNIHKMKDSLEKMSELENYLTKDKLNIQNDMKEVKIKYFSFDQLSFKVNNENSTENNRENSTENKKNKKNKNSKYNSLRLEELNKKEIKDPLALLLYLIKNIKNDSQRLHYIFSLIDLDGIVVNNEIYSKRYNKSMDICGHFYYLKQINYANSPDEKNRLLLDFYNKYSDDGYSEKTIHTCKKCGENIGIIEYDETEGFADSGMLKKSREIWTKEKEQIQSDKLDIFEHLKITDLDDNYLKDVLIKQGLSIGDVETAIQVSGFITKNLFQKCGVILPNQEVVNIIVDSMQKIKGIIPYSIYKAKEIKKLQDKGISKDKIDEFDSKGKIRESYSLYFNIRKSCIISSRFLISVQTIIPTLIRSSKGSICPFNLFNGEDGITYISCILQEMGMIKLREKNKGLELIKINVEEIYNDFKNLVHIKKLFKNKKIYQQEKENKIVDFSFLESDIKNKELVEPIEIGDEYLDLLKEAKDTNAIHNLHKILVNRLLFLAKIIKKSVKDVIAEFQSSNLYSGSLESSCCVEEAISYIDYYYFIEQNSKLKVMKYINESNKIYDFLKYYLQTGTFHKVLLYDKNWFNGVYNYPIVDNQTDTSNSVIISQFEMFVDKGIYAGTLREYIDTIDGQIDIKSGMTKKEILSKEYTIKEYQELLASIEKLNIKYYTPIKIDKIEDDVLNNLKTSSYECLDKEIKKIIDNIAIILNKDSKYIDKYTKLIRNMGIFTELNDMNISSEKEKIKFRERMNKERLDYLKKFYISKLKKYLSIIKNGFNKTFDGFDLSYSSNEDVSLELQSFIYDETQKIAPFIEDDISKYFKDINLNYTNNEINSINGMDNIYNSSYQKIKKYSDFNFIDASNVLLYIIMHELNNMILCSSTSEKLDKKEEFDREELININNINIKCKYICNFINILFEEIENENIIFNDCKKGVEQLNNAMIHDKIEYLTKEYYKDDDDYLLKKMRQQKFNASIDYLSEDIEKAENEYVENMEEQDREYYIIEKGKKELFEKYGYQPSENQLEEYKENYLKNMAENLDIEKDENDFSLDPKRDEVIDQGSGYGTLNEFDFETGDGFDYSAEEGYDE